MGMFDFIRCSANIGELTDSDCQTKDIDKYYGGTLAFYWVDPNGMLFYIDYSGTCDYVDNFKCIPNGNHGRCGPTTLTRDVVIYQTKTQPDGYVDLVECKLTFASGVLQDFSYINNFIEN